MNYFKLLQFYCIAILHAVRTETYGKVGELKALEEIYSYLKENLAQDQFELINAIFQDHLLLLNNPSSQYILEVCYRHIRRLWKLGYSNEEIKEVLPYSLDEEVWSQLLSPSTEEVRTSSSISLKQREIRKLTQAMRELEEIVLNIKKEDEETEAEKSISQDLFYLLIYGPLQDIIAYETEISENVEDGSFWERFFFFPSHCRRWHVLKHLLQNPEIRRKTDAKGNNFWHFAARFNVINELEKQEILIEREASEGSSQSSDIYEIINDRNELGNPPLYEAVQFCDYPRTFEILKEIGAYDNRTFRDQQILPLLQVAMWNPDMEGKPGVLVKTGYSSLQELLDKNVVDYLIKRDRRSSGYLAKVYGNLNPKEAVSLKKIVRTRQRGRLFFTILHFLTWFVLWALIILILGLLLIKTSIPLGGLLAFFVPIILILGVACYLSSTYVKFADAGLKVMKILSTLFCPCLFIFNKVKEICGIAGEETYLFDEEIARLRDPIIEDNDIEVSEVINQQDEEGDLNILKNYTFEEKQIKNDTQNEDNDYINIVMPAQ